MAKRGVEASGGRDPLFLHALSKAWFASGDAGAAIEAAERAMTLVPPKREDLLVELRASLAAYHAAADSE